MDNAFENFMNLLRLKQHGLDDELLAAAKHGEGQSEAVIGDNLEPALLDGVDEGFLRELAAVAPIILEQWNDYLGAGGAMTLEQAFFGGENFALKKQAKTSGPLKITHFCIGSIWSNLPFAKARHRQGYRIWRAFMIL